MDWLHSNVEGFIDRRHARKYAALLLKVSVLCGLMLHNIVCMCVYAFTVPGKV